MTHIEQAIKEAVEFGEWDWKSFQERAGLAEDSDAPIAEVMMDRMFWQELGKARGWGIMGYPMPLKKMTPAEKQHWIGKDEWQYQWHRFIDHLAAGKDVESFFEGLSETGEK